MTRPNVPAPAPSAPGHGRGQQTGRNPCRLACLPGPSGAWQPLTEAHPCVGQHRSVTGAAGRLGRAPRCRCSRPPCRSTWSTPRSQYLATRLRRQLLGVPRQPLQHSRQIPYGYRFSVRSGIAGGRGARTGWPARTLPPDVLNGAAGRGDTWGGLVSSPSRGGGHGRGWRPGSGGVGEGRQRHS